MSHKVDPMLDDHILVTVSDAMAIGDPITVGRGPRFDNALKHALGISGVHQSVVCRRVNELVSQNRLRYVRVGTHAARLGDYTRMYEVVKLLPVAQD